ncbi:hypothetical protein EJB05_28524, partial [Eragrostis curvula]
MASTTKTEQQGRVQPPAAAGEDCSSYDCAATGIALATLLAAALVVQALTTYGDRPASLVLELSCVLCAVLFAWACFTTRYLTAEGRGARRIDGATLRRVMWWIVDAGAVAVLAGWAFGTVAAMLVMYAASLGAAGLFAWCFVEYYRTRNSTDMSSTSDEQDKPATGVLSQNSSANTNGSYQLGGQEYETLDLEAGFRKGKNITRPHVKPMTS